MHTCGIQGNAIHLNADVAAGASRIGSHDKVHEVLVIVARQSFLCGFQLRMVHDRHIRVAERHERAAACDSLIS